MVGDFFRKAGWEVTFGPQMSAEQMAGVLREQWFSIVGISVSCEGLLGRSASVIKTARQSSRNRDIRVFVGGSIFADNREVGRILEADKVFADPRDAVALAQTVSK
jgi:methanogenic corrinoid protein MtbC1